VWGPVDLSLVRSRFEAFGRFGTEQHLTQEGAQAVPRQPPLFPRRLAVRRPPVGGGAPPHVLVGTVHP